MNLGKASKLKNKLIEEIKSFNSDLLSKFPLERYIEYLENYPTISSYKYVSTEIEKFSKDLLTIGNNNILESYHKLILIILIIKAKDKIDSMKLPEDIKNLYSINFNRIINNIERNVFAPGFYMYPQDKFFKELGVCSLKIIPAGAQKINISSLPISFLFKGGIIQFLKGILFIFFKLGGFKPIYDMHTDSHDPNLLAEWNYKGWVRFYIRIAELLKINRHIKGIYGIGWPFDPKLEKISPRHIYLREIVTKNGGKLFYIGPSENAIKSATFKSPTRRKLYREGKYLPTDYMVVWPRKKLIEWANKQNIKLKNLK